MTDDFVKREYFEIKNNIVIKIRFHRNSHSLTWVKNRSNGLKLIVSCVWPYVIVVHHTLTSQGKNSIFGSHKGYCIYLSYPCKLHHFISTGLLFIFITKFGFYLGNIRPSFFDRSELLLFFNSISKVAVLGLFSCLLHEWSMLRLNVVNKSILVIYRVQFFWIQMQKSTIYMFWAADDCRSHKFAFIFAHSEYSARDHQQVLGKL